MFTVGGGVILETNPHKRKRMDEETIRELEIKDQGNPLDILEQSIMEKTREFPSLKDLLVAHSIMEENLKEKIGLLHDQGKIHTYQLTKDTYLLHKNHYNNIKEEINQILDDYHEKYPLRKGISKEELKSLVISKANPRVGDLVLEQLVEEGYIRNPSFVPDYGNR